MKKFMLCLAVAAVAAAITFLAMTYIPQWTQTRGFETPEACALKLFDAVKAQDAQAMEDCLAFDEMAEGFSYQGFSEYVRALMDTYLLPGNDPAGVEFNRGYIRQLWYHRLKRFAFSILSPSLLESLNDNRYIPYTDDAYAEILQAVTAPGVNAFATLEYQGIMTPEYFPDISEAYDAEKAQARLKQNMAFWGIDTYEERILVLRCPEAEAYWGGSELLMPVRFVEIDGRWLADPTGSYVGSILGMYAIDLVFVQE